MLPLSIRVTKARINEIAYSDDENNVKTLLSELLIKEKIIRCPYCARLKSRGAIVNGRCTNCYNKFTKEDINQVIIKHIFNKKLKQNYKQIIIKNLGQKPICPHCSKPMTLCHYRDYYLSGKKACSPKKCSKKSTQINKLINKQVEKEKTEWRNIKSFLKLIN